MILLWKVSGLLFGNIPMQGTFHKDVFISVLAVLTNIIWSTIGNWTLPHQTAFHWTNFLQWTT